MAKLTFNDPICKGCSLCIDVCPKKILRLSKEKLNDKGFHPVECTDESACTACAFCAEMCPDYAIAIAK